MKDLAQQLEPAVPAEEIAAADVAEPEQKAEPERLEPEQQKEKVVPYAALHEERMRRKEMQQQIERERQETAARQAVLNDRLQQIYQQQQPQMRDPRQDADPIEALAHNQNLTLQQMQHMQQRVAWEDAQRHEAAQKQQLVGWAQTQAQEFAKETPDFMDAYQHIYKMRAGELQAMGMSPQEMKAVMERDEISVYVRAYQQGKNPAEFIYNMAKNTGYTGKKPGQAQKMETLQKGVAASKTLGNGAIVGKPTAEQIADMSEDDFARFKQDLKKQGKTVSDVL